ncbi:hypothetical protein BH20PSE1_BH20PSE1_01330 [soil metagenome]
MSVQDDLDDGRQEGQARQGTGSKAPSLPYRNNGARYPFTDVVDSPEVRQVLRELGTLSYVDYGLERDRIAATMGISPIGLDRLVEQARTESTSRATVDLAAHGYCRQDPRTIPPRPFVYARHYAKGFVSATVSPGGGGKSSFGIVEAISMALGRCLYTDEPIRYGPMRVWYLALEDPEDEMARKIEAACLHYGIHEALPNLYVHSGRDRAVCIATEMRSQGGLVSVMAQPDVERIAAECKRVALDAIIVDPSVRSHTVPENDSVKQDKVMGLWCEIGETAGVAIELQHHSRKLNGQEISIDDVRGATSIVNAARSIRLLAPMTKTDAEELEVEEDRRGYHFCVVNGKANFMPQAKDRAWYEFHSVCLGNETPQYQADSVGVAAQWHSRFEKQTEEEKQARARRCTQEDADQVHRHLRSELQLGNRYSQNQLFDVRDSIGLGKDKIRAAVALLGAQGRVYPEERPLDDRRKGSGKYLHPEAT